MKQMVIFDVESHESGTGGEKERAEADAIRAISCGSSIAVSNGDGDGNSCTAAQTNCQAQQQELHQLQQAMASSSTTTSTSTPVTTSTATTIPNGGGGEEALVDGSEITSSNSSSSCGRRRKTFQEEVEAALPPPQAQAQAVKPLSSSSQEEQKEQYQKLPKLPESSSSSSKNRRVPAMTSTEICDDYSGPEEDDDDDDHDNDHHKDDGKSKDPSSIPKKSNKDFAPDGTTGGFAGASPSDDNCVDGSVSSSGTAAVVVDCAQRHSTTILLGVVLLLGIATSAAFVAIGLTGVFNDQQKDFERSAQSTVTTLQTKFEDYEDAASLIHARCRHYRGASGKHWDRRDFRELYEYIIDTGLQFKAMQFDPNITNAERPAAEEEARQFYEEYYPHVNYQGFVGFNTLESTSLEPRTEQPWYFPIHYQEPVVGNEAAIDLDYYSSESRTRAVNALFEHKLPSMTDRLSLVKEEGQVSRCGDHDGPSFGIVLMHPGIELSDELSDGSIINTTERYPQQWPKDFSSIVLCVPDLLNRTTILQSDRKFRVYIHDRSHPYDDDVFMGAAQKDGEDITFLDEIGLDELIYETCDDEKCFTEDVLVANREWTVTIVDDESMPTSTIVVVVIGGLIILGASVLLSLWVWTNHRKKEQMNQIRAQADAEKSLLILQNARQAAKTERELNDFIAHEVRNPVAAAMAATNFVKLEISKPQPLHTDESKEQTKDDVNIIDNALHFINDLLRNLLDMHRAASKQLQINKLPIDILHDVLEPVAGMLYRGRNSNFNVIVECEPKALYVMTDPLRLKQVILNLGRNSIKFVDRGFIRLRAEEMNGNVRIFVDDSGSGIPVEKRKQLFAKFQESLDALNQGTGIGLHLCQNLVDLMEGKLYLDEEYDSGIAGLPGTRFVVDLQTTSIQLAELDVLSDPQHEENEVAEEWSKSFCADGDDNSLPPDLPEKLAVLFIDDDFVLRKLFARAILNVAPGWSVREAANGEAALQLIKDETDQFDLIFCDMYMASVEKQLLGTETITELRNLGCTSRCVGLSANDKEDEFLDAGADAFIFKPMPCDAKALKATLLRLLYTNSHGSSSRAKDVEKMLEDVFINPDV
mmetsp:Transcript_12529/g.30268  ORF Transcript_12529/g.30268 Transcript_12529/m.30268 type:complete len:1099 (-) Transcript_12529:131-3427(-)